MHVLWISQKPCLKFLSSLLLLHSRQNMLLYFFNCYSVKVICLSTMINLRLLSVLKSPPPHPFYMKKQYLPHHRANILHTCTYDVPGLIFCFFVDILEQWIWSRNRLIKLWFKSSQQKYLLSTADKNLHL